jgi:hypothetical protein
MINFNYTVPVNYFSMYGSFFLNSYDSSLLLHPHSFFDYLYKKDKNRVNFLKKVFNDYYNKKENNFIFYKNLINKYKLIFMDIFINKIKDYNKKRKINIKNLIYKSNSLYLSLKNNTILNYTNFKIFKYFNLNILNLYNKENKRKLIKGDLINKNLNLYNIVKLKLNKKIINIYNNIYKIKKFSFLFYKKKISKFLIKIIKIIKEKNIKMFEYYLNKFKLLFKEKKFHKYKNYFSLKKGNFINKLKIRRIKTYPKIFSRIIDEHRYIFNQVTIVLDVPSNYNLFI